MSGRRVYQLICDKETYYFAYCDTGGIFVSPAFCSPERLAKFAVENLTISGEDEYSYEEWLRYALHTKRKLDLTKVEIHKAILSMSNLKLGKPLSHEEAIRLEQVEWFLSTAIFPGAAGKRYYKKYNNDVLGKWITELELRNADMKDYKDEGILERARWNTFQRHKFADHKAHGDLGNPMGEETPEQRKLAGRYLSALAMISKIGGEKRRTPPEIVNHFYRLFEKQ